MPNGQEEQKRKKKEKLETKNEKQKKTSQWGPEQTKPLIFGVWVQELEDGLDLHPFFVAGSLPAILYFFLTLGKWKC